MPVENAILANLVCLANRNFSEQTEIFIGEILLILKVTTETYFKFIHGLSNALQKPYWYKKNYKFVSIFHTV